MPNCLQKALDGPTGKKWDAPTCFSDHAMFLCSHGQLLLAYAGCCCGADIEHDIVEAIMLAVNSVNDCPYCEGLHGQLARMAGTDGAEELRSGKTACAKPSAIPAVTYALACGEADGRGPSEEAAYAVLVQAEGTKRAASIKALSLFLMWGSLTGNTLNCTKKRLIGLAPCGGLSAFSLLFFCYYGPLFTMVFAVNSILKCFPRMAQQGWFFKVMGLTLWALAGLWIWPLGLAGLATKLCCGTPSYTAKQVAKSTSVAPDVEASALH